MELWGELIGCFLYSYLAIGSGVAQLNARVMEQPILTSGPIQVGFAIVFGIVSCTSTANSVSPAHCNPSVTIAHVLFRGFSPYKAPFYVAIQILGGYLACMAVYYQNFHLFKQIEEVLREQGVLDQIQYTVAGPSGVFAFYRLPGQSHWQAWLNEFITSMAAYTVLWATTDPSNPLVPPRLGVWVGAFAFGVAIWSFGTIMNTSRDLGGRFWAMTIWGTRASAGGYAAITSLTNIEAAIVAVFLYEVFMIDSRRVVNLDSLEHSRLLKNRLNYTPDKRKKRDDAEKTVDHSNEQTSSGASSGTTLP
ncbi:hypothetical protein AGABI2DRAFT_177352 [Agaricus bisporus var. bisporus H97]|uniref:hypothetical protein n=1 Tax=Agaricus bisporus var. bisporus (strain H97 / ATCC MYA-4626 / FGSC 10389) TaxID=936046 RepID=UPI00029F7B4A|nr:hypothetical protein AGABI2DRAFT_177352 [Agaricus bisporus var. bisporus H97]EKV49317.1 hypothetical protein AGABI2DRAFT_177352 [Agaricus bisporus var. bisporus H97]